jgi:leucyl-tRNA synthetase
MRLYELFMGPLEQIKMWQTHGVDGVYRFLARTWRLVVDDYSGHINASVVEQAPESSRLNPLLHKTIKKVTADVDALRFNTAISQMMIFMNEAVGEAEIPRKLIEDFLVVLSPFAPHVCEELWQRLGHSDLISHAAWPKHDEVLCGENTVKIVLQVNGKRRDEIEAEKDSDKATLEKRALENEQVSKFIEGKSVERVIVVPNRLVNIVVK